MSMKSIVTVLVAIGALIFTPLASAGPAVMCPAGAVNHITSDAVVCWNEIASEIVIGPQGPPGILSMAKMHGAIHDAVQAYEHRFEPYAIDIATGAGSSSAAVAKAARDVLVAVISAQAAIDTRYANFLSLNGLGGNAGISTGAQAAAAMIALRATDGSFPSPAPTFFGGTGPGQWRSTATPAASMVAPWFGEVTPFTKSLNRCVPPNAAWYVPVKSSPSVRKFSTIFPIALRSTSVCIPSANAARIHTPTIAFFSTSLTAASSVFIWMHLASPVPSHNYNSTARL